MPSRTTGDSHRDARKVREHECFQTSLEEIRVLLPKIERYTKEEIASELDRIFKTLDYKLS